MNDKEFEVAMDGFLSIDPATSAAFEGVECALDSIDARPYFRLMSEFLGLKCAPDLLLSGVFPNGKEITESMAAFSAVRKALGQEAFGDGSITLFDVGAGGTPRTAALFAFMTRWRTFAIDPKCRWEATSQRKRFKRVAVIQQAIEDFDVVVPGLAVITLVHAHCSLVAALRSIRAPDYLVAAMPCCQDLNLPITPLREYKDYGCWSPKRLVRIWRFDGSIRDRIVEESANG